LARLFAPIVFKSSPLPVNNGFGFYDDYDILPVCPGLLERNSQGTVKVMDFWRFVFGLIVCQLLAQGQVFKDKVFSGFTKRLQNHCHHSK
jgi:hypothetical protein